MNLKRKLRLLYADQPPLQKKHFAKTLLHHTAWQNLHPVRAAFLTHAWVSAAFFTLSALAVAGTGFGLIVMFRNAAPPPVIEPPAIETTTVTTSVTTALSTVPTSSVTQRMPVQTVLQQQTTDTLPTMETVQKQTVSQPEQSYSVPIQTTGIPTSFQPSHTETAHLDTTTTMHTALRTEAATELPTATVLETTTVKPETVTAALCRHAYQPSQNPSLEYETRGYPAYDVKRALGLHDAGFLANLTAASDRILSGTICGKQELLIGGEPWTKLTIEVEAAYCGKASETAEIWLAGGTVPLADYLAAHPESTQYADWTPERIANTSLYEPGACSRAYTAGESYLWFLSEEEIAGAPHAVLTTALYADASILQRDGVHYVSANPYQSFSMLSDSVLWYIENVRENVIQPTSQ